MKLLGGVLLLLGVLLVERGVTKKRTGFFDFARWQREFDAWYEKHCVVDISDLRDGDQGGWPTHDGQEAGA